jgi:hypothetical protein
MQNSNIPEQKKPEFKDMITVNYKNSNGIEIQYVVTSEEKKELKMKMNKIIELL